MAESQLATNPNAAQASLEQARQVLASALVELRDLSQGIHPSVLAVLVSVRQHEPYAPAPPGR